MPINPEQWARVKEMFHAALERKPLERLAFVHASCADDDVVCIEVERLLAAHARSGGFIEPPSYAFGDRIGKHGHGRPVEGAPVSAPRVGATRKVAIVVAVLLLTVGLAL